MVNTCSLRGDWSTANLFTYRLTTQEPLFLPLPSHPPFIPCYLTFPFLASSASRLPSSSPPPPQHLLLAFFVSSKVAQIPPSYFLTYVSSPTSSHDPKLSLLSTSPIMSAFDEHLSSSPHLSKHFLPASSLHHSILHPSPDLPV